MSVSEDPDAQQAEIMRAVREASSSWAEAMRAHKMAPPDPGFAARLRSLAEAAEQEQIAWAHAHQAGLLWKPIPGTENAEPPYELRPGTGRRGPPELWERFDETVADLNRVIAGSNAAAVAAAFGAMAAAAGALAEAVEQADGTGAQAAGSRARGAASRAAGAA
jgi:hypothetical protein